MWATVRSTGEELFAVIFDFSEQYFHVAHGIAGLGDQFREGFDKGVAKLLAFGIAPLFAGPFPRDEEIAGATFKIGGGGTHGSEGGGVASVPVGADRLPARLSAYASRVISAWCSQAEALGKLCIK